MHKLGDIVVFWYESHNFILLWFTGNNDLWCVVTPSLWTGPFLDGWRTTPHRRY